MEEPEEKKGGRSYRKRRQSSSEEGEKSDEDPTIKQIEETRALREMKKRKHGVDILAMMPSSDIGETEHISMDDPLRLKSGGGLANMTALRQMTSESAAATTSSIGTAFAAETKRRDEDLELLRYVEEEMTRRRGPGSEKEKSASGSTSRSSNPKAMLYELPDYLKVETKKKKEENLSSQMLTGIPEVDLGIDAKMKNIEETEAAKQKLWEEMRGKKDEASDFVPTNYAVNFVQHNRWSNSTSRVAPNVQAAFVQAAARRANETAVKAAEAAAAAAKVVVQISEPGSEGVGYIPPRPVEEAAPRGKHHHQHKKHNKKRK